MICLGGFDEAAIQLRGDDCDGDQRVGGEQAETLSDLRLDQSQVSLLSGSPLSHPLVDKDFLRFQFSYF